MLSTHSMVVVVIDGGGDDDEGDWTMMNGWMMDGLIG